jgi:hypothetical protein
MQCINVKFTDVLYTVFNGTLLCRDNFDKPLYAFNVVDNTCNAFVTLQYSGQPVSMADRIIQEQNRYWLLAQRPVIGSRMKIAHTEAPASEDEQMQDVPVVIPFAHLERYITPFPEHAEECSICYETQSGERVILHCGHIFHRECISIWLTEKSVRCPMCNYDVRDYVPSGSLLPSLS